MIRLVVEDISELEFALCIYLNELFIYSSKFFLKKAPTQIPSYPKCTRDTNLKIHLKYTPK